jgi:putative ABC transport system permease protein
MGWLTQDLRYALRQLRRSPGFTVVAVITLAVGIGANVGIYSVVNAVLVRGLPYHESDRLGLVWSTDKQSIDNRDQLSYTDIEEYRTHNHTLQNIVAFGDWNAVFSGQDTPERIPGTQVADGYFALMGVRPILGRAFLPEEQIEGKDQVVILGYGLWQRRFAKDPAIVGKQISISARPYTVVGVLPKEFPFLPQSLVDGPAQFYRPVAEKYDRSEARSRHLRAIARLKPGVSLSEVQADLDLINRNLAKQYSDDYATTGIRAVSLQEDIRGNVRPALLLMLGAVGFLLLIACANIANLLLARATGRKREIAVRAAMGASRVQLIRLALTESLLLAIAGGACSLWIANWGIRLISNVGGRVIPQLAEVRVDVPVLAFALAVTFLSSLLCGLFPAIQLSALSVNEVLKEGNRASRGLVHGTLRKGLAISEISLALMLLAGAGLMLRTFLKVEDVDPGFNSKNLLTMGIGLPSVNYPFGSLKTVAFYRELTGRLKSLPGIQGAAGVSILPLGSDFDTVGIEVEGITYGPGEQPYPERYVVTPNYLKVMQIGLLHGRTLQEFDNESAPLVLVVSETAAQRWWPNQDPVGKRIRLPGFDSKGKVAPSWHAVVGVVHDVKQAGLDAPRTMQIYVPQAQTRNGSMTLVLRTSSDPHRATADVRRQIAAMDRDLAISDVMSMDEVLSASVAERRFTTLLLALFSGIGLLLASVGVYGIISYIVSQRTPEIGIRIALGADRSDVLSLVVGQGMRLAITGVAAGLLGALALTRLMSRLLFDVSPSDPITFLCVAFVLAMVSFVAIYIPALRAAKVEPIVALRYE